MNKASDMVRSAVRRLAAARRSASQISPPTVENAPMEGPLSQDESIPLPHGASAYLRPGNPRLVALREAYAALRSPGGSENSFFWTPERVVGHVELAWFRGDNAYVWQNRQLGSDARLKRYIALQEIERQDRLDLLSRLEEDGLFGCWVEYYGGHKGISRDLLDSVGEINFLERHIGITGMSHLKVLDIGAGYGRLAHRMSEALANLERYDCVDGVPESTFVCEYYLQFRGASPRARSVPLDELETSLDDGYDLAVNIHSFSECTHATISWWMKQVASRRIPWLLIVPNHPDELLSTEADFTFRDFLPVVVGSGYELIAKTPIYESQAVRELTGVYDHYFLFRQRP